MWRCGLTDLYVSCGMCVSCQRAALASDMFRDANLWPDLVIAFADSASSRYNASELLRQQQSNNERIQQQHTDHQSSTARALAEESASAHSRTGGNRTSSQEERETSPGWLPLADVAELVQEAAVREDNLLGRSATSRAQSILQVDATPSHQAVLLYLIELRRRADKVLARAGDAEEVLAGAEDEHMSSTQSSQLWRRSADFIRAAHLLLLPARSARLDTLFATEAVWQALEGSPIRCAGMRRQHEVTQHFRQVRSTVLHSRVRHFPPHEFDLRAYRWAWHVLEAHGSIIRGGQVGVVPILSLLRYPPELDRSVNSPQYDFEAFLHQNRTQGDTAEATASESHISCPVRCRQAQDRVSSNRTVLADVSSAWCSAACADIYPYGEWVSLKIAPRKDVLQAGLEWRRGGSAKAPGSGTFDSGLARNGVVGPGELVRSPDILNRAELYLLHGIVPPLRKRKRSHGDCVWLELALPANSVASVEQSNRLWHGGVTASRVSSCLSPLSFKPIPATEAEQSLARGEHADQAWVVDAKAMSAGQSSALQHAARLAGAEADDAERAFFDFVQFAVDLPSRQASKRCVAKLVRAMLDLRDLQSAEAAANISASQHESHQSDSSSSAEQQSDEFEAVRVARRYRRIEAILLNEIAAFLNADPGMAQQQQQQSGSRSSAKASRASDSTVCAVSGMPCPALGQGVSAEVNDDTCKVRWHSREDLRCGVCVDCRELRTLPREEPYVLFSV